MSMKNSNDTSWDQTSYLPICSTAPSSLCSRGPHFNTVLQLNILHRQYICLYISFHFTLQMFILGTSIILFYLNSRHFMISSWMCECLVYDIQPGGHTDGQTFRDKQTQIGILISKLHWY